METEPNIQMQSGLENLKKITPLSKYLSLTLFILMPFVGGWIGYTYAPEKVVEVEKIVVKEVEKTTENQIVDKQDPSNIFDEQGRYAPDTHPLNDMDLYEQTGMPYVTTFSKNYTLHVLGGRDSYADTIYKYNDITQTYEPLGIDILEATREINRNGVTVLGWSSDLRYLMISPGGPGQNLYYLDTEDLQRGIIDPGEFYVTSVVSPDYTKILAVTKAAGDDEPHKIVSGIQNDLYVFDMDTLNSKKVYSHDGSVLTFLDMEHYFGTYFINGEWTNNNEVRLTITPVDVFNKYHESLSEEKRVEYETAQNEVLVSIN